MDSGFLEYKCRRCGAIIKAAHVPNVYIAMARLITDGTTPKEWGMTVRLLQTHSCDDGNVGITDFIGVVRDENIKGGRPDEG